MCIKNSECLNSNLVAPLSFLKLSPPLNGFWVYWHYLQLCPSSGLGSSENAAHLNEADKIIGLLFAGVRV